MNRPERHHIRLRAQGRRRIGTTTGWAVAAGGMLSAVFGVLFAQATPPAAASEPAPAISVAPDGVAAPDLAAPTVPDPVTSTRPAPRHRAPVLQPPTRAPRSSKATAPLVSSGAS